MSGGPRAPRPERSPEELGANASPSRTRAASPIDRGISEFGECMAALLESLPAARGAVLSDAWGEPIDGARRSWVISEIDLQLAGAQIGQPMARLRRNAIVFGLGKPTVIAEASEGLILARPVAKEYLFTLVAASTLSLSRALLAFEHCASELETLVG